MRIAKATCPFNALLIGLYFSFYSRLQGRTKVSKGREYKKSPGIKGGLQSPDCVRSEVISDIAYGSKTNWICTKKYIFTKCKFACMAEILPIRRKTLSNQSINDHLWLMHYLINECTLLVTYRALRLEISLSYLDLYYHSHAFLSSALPPDTVRVFRTVCPVQRYERYYI